MRGCCCRAQGPGHGDAIVLEFIADEAREVLRQGVSVPWEGRSLKESMRALLLTLQRRNVLLRLAKYMTLRIQKETKDCTDEQKSTE